MIASILRRLQLQLRYGRNPLLRDPAYRGLDALEQDMRRRHMPVAKVSAAKQERLHQMLRGA